MIAWTKKLILLYIMKRLNKPKKTFLHYTDFKGHFRYVWNATHGTIVQDYAAIFKRDEYILQICICFVIRLIYQKGGVFILQVYYMCI